VPDLRLVERDVVGHGRARDDGARHREDAREQRVERGVVAVAAVVQRDGNLAHRRLELAEADAARAGGELAREDEVDVGRRVRLGDDAAVARPLEELRRVEVDAAVAVRAAVVGEVDEHLRQRALLGLLDLGAMRLVLHPQLGAVRGRHLGAALRTALVHVPDLRRVQAHVVGDGARHDGPARSQARLRERRERGRLGAVGVDLGRRLLHHHLELVVPDAARALPDVPREREVRVRRRVPAADHARVLAELDELRAVHLGGIVAVRAAVADKREELRLQRALLHVLLGLVHAPRMLLGDLHAVRDAGPGPAAHAALVHVPDLRLVERDVVGHRPRQHRPACCEHTLRQARERLSCRRVRVHLGGGLLQDLAELVEADAARAARDDARERQVGVRRRVLRADDARVLEVLDELRAVHLRAPARVRAAQVRKRDELLLQ